MSKSYLPALLVTLGLAGCAAAAPAAPVASATPVAASVAPTPAATFDQARRPFGPPEADRPAFGAFDAIWTTEGERVALYGLREQPFSGKTPGTTTSYYVYVGGRVYGIHWDDLAKFKVLKLHETANLHPADTIACKEDATLPAGTRCWRLYRVYPGTRRIQPL